MKNENHCDRVDCMCTHTHGCIKGWIWLEYYDEREIKVNDGAYEVHRVKYDGVRPCPTCDPVRAELAETCKTSWEYHEKLRSRSTYTKQKAYEDEERSGTRTL